MLCYLKISNKIDKLKLVSSIALLTALLATLLYFNVCIEAIPSMIQYNFDYEITITTDDISNLDGLQIGGVNFSSGIVENNEKTVFSEILTVNPEYFTVAGYELTLGSYISYQDYDTAILSYKLAQELFVSCNTAIGAKITINDNIYIVSGIIKPRDNFITSSVQETGYIVWLPSVNAKISSICISDGELTELEQVEVINQITKGKTANSEINYIDKKEEICFGMMPLWITIMFVLIGNVCKMLLSIAEKKYGYNKKYKIIYSTLILLLIIFIGISTFIYTVGYVAECLEITSIPSIEDYYSVVKSKAKDLFVDSYRYDFYNIYKVLLVSVSFTSVAASFCLCSCISQIKLCLRQANTQVYIKERN